MPFLKCGEQEVAGAMVYGVGQGRTKTAARRAAIKMADAYLKAASEAQIAAYRCPRTECGEMYLRAVARLSLQEIATVAILPDLYQSLVSKSYTLKLGCR